MPTKTWIISLIKQGLTVLLAVFLAIAGATVSAEASGPDGVFASSVEDASPSPEVPAVTPSRQVQVPASGTRPAYWAFIPTGTTAPRTILLALHGMGQVGDSLGGQLMPFAQERNWVVIAPTIDYGEWRDPERLALAETRVLPQVLDVVDHARRELGVATRERIVVFGFSRGAHAAARLGLLYPNRVVGVAAASGSAYTLPTAVARNGAGRPVAAPFPLGTADIARYFGKSVDENAVSRVQYWVGVGANDDRDADAPRAWDVVLGKNRLERAARFANAMEQAGCVTRISVTAGAGHELLPPAIDDGVRFLAAAVTIDGLRESRFTPTKVAPTRSVVLARTGGTSPSMLDVPPDSVVPPTALMPLRQGASFVPPSFSPKAVWTRLVARYVAQ
jgi:poly(3-hydroxybutyrate) depolymerase